MSNIKALGIFFSICSLVELGYLYIISSKYKDKNIVSINLIKIIITLFCMTFIEINVIILLLFIYQIYISLKYFDELFSELIINLINLKSN
mgnify:CR=1 FL=1